MHLERAPTTKKIEIVDFMHSFQLLPFRKKNFGFKCDIMRHW